MTTYVGTPMKRKEDPRMITGRGYYTEDINLPGMLHAVLVRSPEAHAAITSWAIRWQSWWRRAVTSRWTRRRT
jgi:CO/xanthine dehydrogenase Mo-binding subunit